MIEVEEFLEHAGVKGMKWGVRKEKASGSSGSSELPKGKSAIDAEALKAQRKARAKKVAMGVGILLVAAGAAYAANNMQKNGTLKASDLSKFGSAASKASAKKVVEKATQEPSAVLHATRTKRNGFTFRKDGGLDEVFGEYEKAFPQDSVNERNTFARYGKDNEKVAARFDDPEGRTDQAGRVIPHEVIIPRSMSAGINNLDDVRTKIWPSLKDEYDAAYDLPSETRRA